MPRWKRQQKSCQSRQRIPLTRCQRIPRTNRQKIHHQTIRYQRKHRMAHQN